MAFRKEGTYGTAYDQLVTVGSDCSGDVILSLPSGRDGGRGVVSGLQADMTPDESRRVRKALKRAEKRARKTLAKPAEVN